MCMGEDSAEAERDSEDSSDDMPEVSQASLEALRDGRSKPLPRRIPIPGVPASRRKAQDAQEVHG